MIFKLLKNKKKSQENSVFKIQKSHKKTREKSHGRSMVEMLGVLAIIGVLSIGGIQGYTLAMRKYRANEILNSAGKYAFLLYANCQRALAENDDYYYMLNPGGVRSAITWICPKPIEFIDSGLGGLPTGAQQIEAMDIYSYDQDGDYALDHKGWDQPHDPNMHSYSAYIFTRDNIDTVSLRIKFDSKELCETAQALVGSKYTISYSDLNDANDKKTSCDDGNLYFMNFVEN